jgi:CheY-like chemotaxis protein
MLAFARRQELKPETLDVATLVGSMEEMLRRTLGPSIEIVTEFHEGLPAIRVDPNQLELGLLNLALNARDAMPMGGRLAVTARRMVVPTGPPGLSAGDYVCVSVQDSGIGMDEPTVRRATEPFFSTKGAGKGTGLGLSMVDGLAAQSGGAMRILSRLGEGTTVELWLPVSEQEAAPVGQPVAGPRGGGWHCRVLVVDDDQLISMATTEMLEDLGHSVVEASSGKAALELIRHRTDIELVITDHAMPGMTGTELARQIKSQWPNLPVILATGYADLPNEEDAEWPRLSKPYLQDDLAAAIARVFESIRATANIVPLDAA